MTRPNGRPRDIHPAVPGHAPPEPARGGGHGGLPLATAALGRAEALVPELAQAIASADYGEAGRHAFEIRASLRRAERAIEAGGEATAATTLAHERLVTLRARTAPLLAIAPELDAPGAGSEAAEAAWRAARGAPPVPARALATAAIAQPTPRQLEAAVIAAGRTGPAMGGRWEAAQVAAMAAPVAPAPAPAPAPGAEPRDRIDVAEELIVNIERRWVVLDAQFAANELNDQPSKALLPALRGLVAELHAARVLLDAAAANVPTDRERRLRDRLGAVTEELVQ